jgi:hypothetical protein
MVFTLVFNLFVPETRAQNFNKTWTTTADFNTGTNSNIDTTGDQAKLATSTSNALEDFTTSTKKDAASDANWDTVAHKLTLPGDPVNGTATDLQAKWKAAVGTTGAEYINSQVCDPVNHYIYLGSNSGTFMALRQSDNVMINLTSKISGTWSTNAIYSIAFDSTNNKIYLGSNTGKFGVFTGGSDPASGTYVSLTSKISTDWQGAPIDAMAFDSINGKMYIGGHNGNFGVFTGVSDPANGTWVYLRTKIGADISTAAVISAMAFDSTNGKIYFGTDSSSGVSGCFTGGSDPANGTWILLTSKITIGAVIWSMTFDSTNGILYFGGGSGYFGAFAGGANPASGIWTNLNGKIASWSSNAVYSLTFDSTNGKVYLGGNGGVFGAFAGGSNPSAGTGTNLTSKISADWSTNRFYSFSSDSANGKIYLSDSSGKFGSFIGGSTPASGTWTNLTGNINAPFVGYDILASVTDTTNNIIYLGGASGKFAAYIPATDTMIDLTSKISANWVTDSILSITLDSTNGIVYLGGSSAKIGAFKGGASPRNGTWYYLRNIGTFATNWATQTVSSLAFDSTNGFMYLGGASGGTVGRFGAFAANATPSSDTWTYLSAVGSFSTDWGTSDIRTLVYDLADGKIFIGGSNTGKFGVFTGGSVPGNGSWVSLNSKNAGFNIYAFTLDPSFGRLYVGGWNGYTDLALFTGLADPANGTWTALPQMLGEYTINSMIFLGGKIFAGNNGTNNYGTNHFGYFNCGNNPSLGSWTNLSAKINSFWSTNSVSTIVATSSTMFYLAGATGEIASFYIGYSTNKSGISIGMDSTAQVIGKATLTATSVTPTNTAITYYLSNNGGTTWNAVTSGVEYTFSTAASDLRWKATMTTTDAAITPEVDSIALAYKYFGSYSGTMDLIFDATQAVTPTLLSWTNTLPTNTTLTFKIRSAPTSDGLSSAVWSDTKNATDTPVNLKAINVGGATGVPENEFSEAYITFTTSDGIDTPVLSDITEQYVINAPPQLQSLTASQATDGSKVVNISYQLKDSDSHSNPYNQDQVAIAYQYSTDSGATWHSCTTITNSGLLAVNSDNSWKNESAIWNIATDLPTSYYNGTVEVKVLANDNEQAHNTAQLASTAFSTDTKNPTLGAIGSNSGIQIGSGTSWVNTPSVNLTLSASDDTTKYMEIRNDTNFIGTKEAYSSSKANYALSANDGAKTVYVRFYDTFDNTVDSSTSALLDTTPPNIPANFTIFDTSNIQAGTFSIVVVWNPINDPGDFSLYSLERSVDGGGYSPVATFSNIASNAYSDMGLSSASTYSYQMKTVDIHSNYSGYTTVQSLKPAGTDTVAPTITGAGPTPTCLDITCTIAWTTNKPSDSYVNFGATSSYGFSQGSNGLVVSHSVTLIGLTQLTTYHFNVTDRQAAGVQVASNDATFTTSATVVPVISSDIAGTATTGDPLAITVHASDNSGINFAKISFDNGNTWDNLSTQVFGIYTYNYSVASSANSVSYQVKFGDAAGNFTTDSKSVAVTDNDAPTIVSNTSTDAKTGAPMTVTLFANDNIGVTSAQISFDTGASWSDMTSAGNGGYNYIYNVSNTATSLSYSVRIKDATNNTISADKTVTVSDIIPPVITSASPSLTVADISATISWTTDKLSDSYIEFGTTTDYGHQQGEDNVVGNHAVEIVGLNPTTTYHYRVKSKSLTGNQTISPDYTFTTTLPVESQSGPQIAGSTAQRPGADPEEVTIIWTTDRYASSQVWYGSDSTVLDQKTTEDTTLNKTHFVAITHLHPNTRYYYKAYSQDTYGNVVWGEENYFVTAETGLSSTPTITAVQSTDTTLTSTIISWQTTTVATSLVELGTLPGTYDTNIADQSLGSTTQHVVRLSGLIQGTTYHYRVMGQSSNNTWIASDDYTFSTVPMPAISDIQVKGIGSVSSTITWNINIPAQSQVNYGATSLSQSQGDTLSATAHSVTLNSLVPATKYQFQIVTEDSYGNKASSDIQSFQTIIDTIPPVISNMKSEVSVVTDPNGGTSAQAIVSWSTDEPATSQVKYAMGVVAVDDYPLSTQEEPGLTTSHVVIISNLQPSATYHMRLISKDSSANIGSSDDYTIITSSQQKTLLEYVVQILQNRFSWVSNLGIDL